MRGCRTLFFSKLRSVFSVTNASEAAKQLSRLAPPVISCNYFPAKARDSIESEQFPQREPGLGE